MKKLNKNAQYFLMAENTLEAFAACSCSCTCSCFSCTCGGSNPSEAATNSSKYPSEYRGNQIRSGQMRDLTMGA